MSINNQKWSFDVIKLQVEQLQNEFNLKLVSVLNSCDEDVVLSFITTSSPIIKPEFDNATKENPVIINLYKKQDALWAESVKVYNSVK